MSLNDRRAEARREFVGRAGWQDAAIAALPGDASTRRYFRVSRNGDSAMLMDQPQQAESPPCPPTAAPQERQALGYNAVARLAGADCARFIAASEFLRARGLSAPEIYAADTQAGFVLIEDLGDALYADVLAGGEDEDELYGAAIDALARLHDDPAPQTLTSGKDLYIYDETALLAETDLMTEWFLPLALGRAAGREEVEEHRTLWRERLAHIHTQSRVFVHRDYHAQNLFWLPEREGIARVGVIDFQDAVAGTRGYDPMSLLEDARRDVAPDLRARMMKRYLAAMRAEGHAIDADKFEAEAALIAAQRNAKIAGIFARLFVRDGKPRYLSYLPRVWGHLERDLAHPELASLRSWYDRTIPPEMRRVREPAGVAA